MSQIGRVFQNKFDKSLSSKKIRNLIQKLAHTSIEDTVRLQTFLEGIEEDGRKVKSKFDSDGNVSVLFVASHSMVRAFLNSSATTIQVDISFDFDASKYKLCAFCYLNPITNRSELCALAFIAEETGRNFRDTFQIFKSMCSKSPSVFIVDKDLNEVAILREVFPLTSILLCTILQCCSTVIHDDCLFDLDECPDCGQ